jgi:hypothetical protein
VADQTLANRNTRVGALIALADHRLVMQSNQGATDNFLSSAFGFQKLKRLGISPTITGQPSAVQVALGASETGRDVSFTAAAGGEPAPAIQWQAKAPGATRFTDVAGATGATLGVSAQRGMDGTRYRAVFANAAGRVATTAATLAVDFAPQIAVDVADRAVAPGEDATFEVMAGGNPEPTITWQRRVGGFWQAIGADDDDFVVAGARLTIPDTNTDQSGALVRAKLTNAVGTVYSRTAKLTVGADTTTPAQLDGVVLDWAGSAELQGRPPFGDSNYFSAGVSDGTQGTYSATAGGVAVFQVAGGVTTPATWATHAAHTTNGGSQLVRLSNGHATLAADGSATIAWTGSFTVNFYGGLVPFTITDPVLRVDASGAGTLTAGRLSGYASSRDNPSQSVPLPPVANVVFATFTGVHLDRAGRVNVTPAYAGVRVTLPAGTTPQDTTTAGWGAWPQPFVDFQLDTGLSSYWYSSGGAADPQKPPLPFAVDFTSADEATDPPPPPSDDGSETTAPPAGSASTPTPEAVPTPVSEPAATTEPSVAPPAPAQRPVITAKVSNQRVGRTGTATVASIACGSAPCSATAPKTVRVRIAGRTYTARVVVSRAAPAGGTVTVRLVLPKQARQRLAGHRARVAVRVTVTSAGAKLARTAPVSVRAPKSRR